MQLLQEPGSHVGEVIKVMSKKKVLVKVQPEGKYGKQSYIHSDMQIVHSADLISLLVYVGSGGL